MVAGPLSILFVFFFFFSSFLGFVFLLFNPGKSALRIFHWKFLRFRYPLISQCFRIDFEPIKKGFDFCLWYAGNILLRLYAQADRHHRFHLSVIQSNHISTDTHKHTHRHACKDLWPNKLLHVEYAVLIFRKDYLDYVRAPS